VSETTEGRGGGGEYYFGVSPRVDLFGVSSTALAQGALPMEWSSSKHGFHGAC
jgi:vacuolar protein sorting-associated protein 54